MKTLSFSILSISFVLGILNGCSPPIETNPSPSNPTAISISADKMNIFRIGVSNPITITTHNIPSEDLNLSISQGSITPNGNYKYNVSVSKPGSTILTVSAKNLKPTQFHFKVERIKDPIARLSKHRGGFMNSGEFRAQGGVSAVLNCADFDAKCKVDGFDVGRVPKGKTLIEASNKGARYEGDVAQLITQASAGDVYFFHKVKVRCPGDAVGREINSMVFKIK